VQKPPRKEGYVGSAALDVVFGLIFVYLVLSLICSALNEKGEPDAS